MYIFTYMKKLIFLTIIIVTLGSCRHREYKYFYTDNLELRQLNLSNENVSNVSGSFFLIAGDINGHSSKKMYINLLANVNGYYRYLKFPLSDILIKVDNNVDIPYIKLKYSSYKEIGFDDILLYKYPRVIIYCPEKLVPETIYPIDIDI